MGKVIIATNSHTGGGAERSMNLLANLLYRNGCDVSLFPINFGFPDAVIIECETVPPIREWKSGLLPTINSIINFRKSVIKAGASTVILNCELPELLSIFLPKRIRLIVVEHTSKPWQGRELLGRLVRATLRMRKANWVLVSPHLKSLAHGKLPSKVIPNLLTPNHHMENSNRSATADSGAPSRIVFVGRLSQEKNPELFLKIAKLSEKPGLVIGTGVQLAYLEKFANQQELRVSFLGQLVNPWAQISANDLLIVTSEYEGDGLVVLEALTQKLPLLLRNIPDLQRFGLPEKNYFGSAEEAATSIQSAGANFENFRIPTEISTKILRERNSDEILQKWLSVLDLN